jgi:hypothetical protein
MGIKMAPKWSCTFHLSHKWLFRNFAALDHEVLMLYYVQTSQLLATKAVILRLQAGSQEAGFLSAFCPIDRVPSLVVIQ